MRLTKYCLLLALLTMAGCSSATPDPAEKLIIAHRGASGYVPEHTMAAKAMAYAQGADYIEQDLVMTKDDAVVVLHDHHLDTVTDVRAVFPHRARSDGRFYVVDFTLEEIRSLSVSERFSTHDGNTAAVFPDRFPLGKSSFRIHTFEEEIELIQGLNQSMGGAIGIYPEIKSPKFHRDEGKDISVAVLKILESYGYTDETAPVFLQCFDADELVRIHNELLPAMNMRTPLVQLLDTEPEYAELLTEEGMQRVAEYAVGIGPWIENLVDGESKKSALEISPLAGWAHAAGLQIHAYTFRRDAGQIPSYASDFDDLLRIFFDEVGIDGVFTDFPDLAVQYVRENP